MRKMSFVYCALCILLLTQDAMANLWFKGEAAVRDNFANIEQHQFFIRWMRKAHGSEDVMTVLMGVMPKSPVFSKAHDGEPMTLIFDMRDSKGNTIGEVKFIVPSEGWRWDRYSVGEYLRKWNKRYRDFDDDWFLTKILKVYFHGIFTVPKECAALFLKSVRTYDEDIYYDMRNVGPKLLPTNLKSAVDKRSIRCNIEVKAAEQQDATGQQNPRKASPDKEKTGKDTEDDELSLITGDEADDWPQNAPKSTRVQQTHTSERKVITRTYKTTVRGQGSALPPSEILRKLRRINSQDAEGDGVLTSEH